MERYDRISTYFKENRLLVIVLCITDFLFNALMCLIPIVQGMAVNALANGEGFRRICMLTMLFLGLVAFVQVNRYVKRHLGRSFGNRMALRMRTVGYANLKAQPMEHFQKTSKGDILNKMLTDIDDASDGITKMTTEVFDTIVLLAGYLAAMLYMDVQITGFVMLFVLVSIMSTKLFKKLIYKYTMEYKGYLSSTKDMTLYCLKNELSYRGLGISGSYRERYEKAQDILEKKALKSMVLQNCLEPLYSILTWLGLFFIVWLGGGRVIRGTMDIGSFTAFLSTYLLVAQKASRLGRVYGWYQNLRVSWVRVRGYLTKCDDGREVVAREGLPKDFTLELRDFSFGFDEQFCLPKMSMTLHKGELVGVCGVVHTGKSTLLSGLSGLYPYEGSAKLGGRELRDSVLPVGFCSSANLIFEDTLAYNVHMGREGDMEEALHGSRLSADMAGFPKGAQTKLSHSLVNLSGGQTKRLLTARAIYGRRPLILLDDPFQSVDKENARHMTEYLHSLSESIVLVVSNQSFILEEMDRIIFLTGDGYEVGTYEELKGRGMFANREVKV